jgi:hypothetical protein
MLVPTHETGSVIDFIMRQLSFIAAALLLIACGPDPNAKLPFYDMGGSLGAGGAIGTGGIGAGGAPGTGGATTSSGGSTTAKGGIGGTSGISSGGASGIGSGGKTTGTGGAIPLSGGTTGSSGGIASLGGGTGAGGVVGSGGMVGIDGGGGSGGDNGIDGGGGDEPCSPAKVFTGGKTGDFATKDAFCFKTAESIAGWNCSSFDGRTLKVNNVTETCGTLPLPAKINGYYYFDASAGSYIYAAIYWW